MATKVKGSKANSRQSTKKKGYYTRQKARTEANKLRRMKKLAPFAHKKGAPKSEWRRAHNKIKQEKRKHNNALIRLNRKTTTTTV